MSSGYRIKKRARSPPPEEPAASEPPGAQSMALAADSSAPPDRATSRPVITSAAPLPHFPAGPSYQPIPDSAMRAANPRPGGRIPDGWRECSKGGAAINGLAPVKTPLSEDFDTKLHPEERWTPADCLSACGGSRVGLFVDLTNTKRYYDPARLPSGVRYIKLSTEGHSLPSEESIQRVLTEIAAMRHARGDGSVAVMHCTHGLNRTGFLLVYALCVLDGCTLAEALTIFGQVRPPGLWREQYVQALHDKFGGPLPPLPQPPEWDRGERTWR